MGADENNSWDNLYTRELSNNINDPDDVGTIWFDDSSAEDKMVSFLRSPSLGLDISTASFLDSGTGNGHMLIRLREETAADGDDYDSDDEDIAEKADDKVFKGRMLGTDYSTKSIEFAMQVAVNKSMGPGGEAGEVEFVEWDILKSSPFPLLTDSQSEGWDVVLDKGTFDAISLSDEKDAQGRRIVEGYKERIMPLMKKGGRLLVTSCNWTEVELKGWFHDELKEGLRYENSIEYHSFSFGGRNGQTISSCCFIKQYAST